MLKTAKYGAFSRIKHQKLKLENGKNPVIKKIYITFLKVCTYIMSAIIVKRDEGTVKNLVDRVKNYDRVTYIKRVAFGVRNML